MLSAAEATPLLVRRKSQPKHVIGRERTVHGPKRSDAACLLLTTLNAHGSSDAEGEWGYEVTMAIVPVLFPGAISTLPQLMHRYLRTSCREPMMRVPCSQVQGA